MTKGNNIVPFPETTHGMSQETRENLETILHFFTRQTVSYRDCEYSKLPLAQIRPDEDALEAESAAFIYPVRRWPIKSEKGQALGELIVVDVGRLRAFYYHTPTYAGLGPATGPSG